MTIELPNEVALAAATTADFDAVLVGGIARIQDAAPLHALAAAVATTPLGTASRDAAVALAQGETLPHHLAVMAAARASIEAARFDALFRAATAALGVEISATATTEETAPTAEQAAAMEGLRHWLVEVAFAGLGQLERATVVPAVDGLRAIQEDPALSRLAAVATGFVHELLDHVPTARMDEIPARRWTDLWTSSFLATYALPAQPTTTTVSGEFLPLGAELRHHDHQASVVVHGVLESDGQRRIARTTLSAWKVDAISGDEIWKLLQPQAPHLFASVAKPKHLAVTDMTLVADRDLIWNQSVTEGEPFDPWEVELAGTTCAPPPPRDRHPMALGLPCDPTQLDLPIDYERTSKHLRLNDASIVGANAVMALIRFDTDWSIQPIAARGARKKMLGPAEAIAAAAKIKKPSFDVLTERASKLLRG